MAGRELCFLAVAILPRLLAAQGVTTAAIQGTVSAADGSRVAGASVRFTSVASGRRWEVVTRADGRFLLEAISVGVYRMEARAVGFVPQVRTDVALALGQRVVLEFSLQPVAIELEPVTVHGTPDPVLDPGRTGPAEIIPRAAIAGLPNLGRSFFNLAFLSPQVVNSPATPAVPTSGIAIGGQNRLYNSFQIDGGVDHDVYRGMLPGRQSFPRPIALEALEEIRVLVAPFDVRYGAFAGGLVNAVTRSGANHAHGSLFAYLSDDALVRRGGVGDQVGDFRTWQFGATAGGPIVRDRAHFFVSAGVQRRVVPDPGPLIGDTAGGADVSRIGIDYASAVRLQTILDTLYGLDAGTLGPVNGRAPATDLFGKASVQLATGSQLEASYHFVSGERRDILLRTYNYYALSSFGQREPSTSHAVRLVWTTLVGGLWSNELLLSYLRLRDECRPNATFPEITVSGFVGQAFLDVGDSGTCPPSVARQGVMEVTDNATLGLGRHALSVGAHAELLRFRDDLVNGSPGQWSFGNLDSLEAGLANRYRRTLRGPSWNGGVNFPARQLAVYVQDRWSPTSTLTLTAGLRLDFTFLPDAPATNDSLKSLLGVDTGRLPSRSALWSPRFGFNYDLGGTGRTYLRGGIGLFAARPPYRWVSNAYRDDGTQELFLDCRFAQVPRFDPFDQPARCVSTGPAARLSAFDPGTRFPQNLKVSLGVDRRLPAGLIGTVDVLYTSAVHQLYVTDANLAPPSGVSQGEGGRTLYGTINATTGTATPARLSTAFGQVVRVSSTNGDHAWSVSAQLRTRTDAAVQGSAFYAYTRTRDRMSLAHVQARAMLEGTVLDGTLENRKLGTSLFEIPHRVEVVATVRLPYRSSIALVYAAASGRPFTYTVSGDANADGLGVNLRQDPVYVPRDRADISIDGNGRLAGVGTSAQQDSAYALLDQFINEVPCLRQQRGRLLARNSCRNRWFGTLNARVTKAFPTIAGHTLELTAEMYNVMNLINSRWGLSKYDAVTFGADLLALRGYDATAGRGIYAVMLPPRGQVEDLASRWQVELSVRYVF